MKRQIITIAMLALLTAATSSCQKELDDSLATSTSQADENRTMIYYIDGCRYTRTISSEQEWDELHRWLFSLAKRGCRIVIGDTNQAITSLSKDVQTYVTTNEADAIKWAKKMEADDYIVTVNYNGRTGEFICTAIK